MFSIRMQPEQPEKWPRGAARTLTHAHDAGQVAGIRRARCNFGRDAIESLHATWTHGHGEATEKEMTVIHAGSSHDLAWCLATYTEGLEVGNGTSFAVFERQADGPWLIRMCSLNSTDNH